MRLRPRRPCHRRLSARCTSTTWCCSSRAIRPSRSTTAGEQESISRQTACRGPATAVPGAARVPPSAAGPARARRTYEEIAERILEDDLGQGADSLHEYVLRALVDGHLRMHVVQHVHAVSFGAREHELAHNDYHKLQEHIRGATRRVRASATPPLGANTFLTALDDGTSTLQTDIPAGQHLLVDAQPGIPLSCAPTPAPPTTAPSRSTARPAPGPTTTKDAGTLTNAIVLTGDGPARLSDTLTNQPAPTS